MERSGEGMILIGVDMRVNKVSVHDEEAVISIGRI